MTVVNDASRLYADPLANETCNFMETIRDQFTLRSLPFGEFRIRRDSFSVNPVRHNIDINVSLGCSH